MKWLPLVFIFICGFTLNGLTQQKFEREYRIKEQQVPKEALSFLSKVASEQKVKWFREESPQGTSIEAKVVIEERLHSIEFDTLGKVQDVEILIKSKSIPKATFDQMNKQLNNVFQKYQYSKIQLQYIGNVYSLTQAINSNSPDQTIVKNYETVIKGKNEDGMKLYEITFDESGQIIGKEEIVFKNADHLEY